MIEWHDYSNPSWWDGVSREQRHYHRKRILSIIAKYGLDDWGDCIRNGIIEGGAKMLEIPVEEAFQIIVDNQDPAKESDKENDQSPVIADVQDSISDRNSKIAAKHKSNIATIYVLGSGHKVYEDGPFAHAYEGDILVHGKVTLNEKRCRGPPTSSLMNLVIVMLPLLTNNICNNEKQEMAISQFERANRFYKG